LVENIFANIFLIGDPPTAHDSGMLPHLLNDFCIHGMRQQQITANMCLMGSKVIHQQSLNARVPNSSGMMLHQ
jgi:hypothetical protein